LFSRFDWSIFVTQLVARHMKEIIIGKNGGCAGIFSYYVITWMDAGSIERKYILQILASHIY
jgi:hypothetical protein